MATKPAIVGKDALVAAVAQAHSNVTKADLTAIVDTLLDKIHSELVAGNSVRLHNVGTLNVKVASARQSRNVHTGAIIQVPERNAVRFSVASELKKAVAASPIAA